MASKQEPLLTGSFMQKLDRLDLLSRKIISGKLHGQRRSKRKGRSVEFADYRPYGPGDDLRFIDWNLYARLDRLFLRLFNADEDLSVSILLDTTQSMAWGEPDKLLYAKRLAAALGYVGLVGQNRLKVYSIADGIVDRVVNLRGRRRVEDVLAFLRRQEPQPTGCLAAACRAFALADPTKGIVILISDFLDPGNIADALRYLAQTRYDVYAIQILAPQELNPEAGRLTGDLELVDCELGSSVDVSVGPALLRRYHDRLRDHCRDLRRSCFSRGIDCLTGDTSVAIETVVLQHLRQRRLLG